MKRRTMVVEGPETSPPPTLVTFLSAALAGQSEDVPALIARGAVYVDGRRQTDAALVLRLQQKVSVVLSESGVSPLAVATKTREPVLLHEEDAFLVFDKPEGMTSQPTPGRVGDSLWDWVKARFGQDAGLVHRLDRDTSGVILLGRGRAMTSALALQFRLRSTQKQYLAITQPGLPEAGACQLPISRDPSRPGRYRASERANGLSAHTDFERRFQTDTWSGVALFPRTGRTHQLRAHLTALGFPIVGDTLYGGAHSLDGVPVPRCLLHAEQLSFQHPTRGGTVTFTAPLPEDLKKFWLA